MNEFELVARDLKAENARLKSELEALKIGLRDCVYALRCLHDFQNGPPLCSYEDGWNSAMKSSQKCLSEWEPKCDILNRLPK